MTGLVVQPYRGYRKEGAKGFGIGVLKGLAGCIVKPTAGAMDMVTHTFQGIKGTAVALDGHSIITRVRTPRYFTNDGALSWYSTREAEGYCYCVLLNIDTTEMYIYHIAITDPTHTKKKKNTQEKRVLMVTDRYVRIVYVKATGSRPRGAQKKGEGGKTGLYYKSFYK